MTIQTTISHKVFGTLAYSSSGPNHIVWARDLPKPLYGTNRIALFLRPGYNSKTPKPWHAIAFRGPNDALAEGHGDTAAAALDACLHNLRS